MPNSEPNHDPPSENGGRPLRLLVLVLVLGAMVLGLSQAGRYLSLDELAAQEQALRQYQANHPLLVFGIALSLYVAITGLSLPGATALTLVYGWYFGFLPAVVLVSFASTAGATLAFLLSRYLFRDALQSRFRDRLQQFNHALEADGAYYLFTLRLIPAVPFFVINAVMGLTPLRARTFWWVSQLGMLPATLVYVYAGSSVPDLQTLAAEKGLSAVFTPWQVTQILIALILLGVFPLVVRFATRWILPSATEPWKSEHDAAADTRDSRPETNREATQ